MMMDREVEKDSFFLFPLSLLHSCLDFLEGMTEETTYKRGQEGRRRLKRGPFVMS